MCNLHSRIGSYAKKSLTFDWMFCCHCLKIIHLWTRGPRFSFFNLWDINYIAFSPARFYLSSHVHLRLREQHAVLMAESKRSWVWSKVTGYLLKPSPGTGTWPLLRSQANHMTEPKVKVVRKCASPQDSTYHTSLTLHMSLLLLR